MCAHACLFIFEVFLFIYFYSVLKVGTVLYCMWDSVSVPSCTVCGCICECDKIRQRGEDLKVVSDSQVVEVGHVIPALLCQNVLMPTAHPKAG